MFGMLGSLISGGLGLLGASNAQANQQQMNNENLLFQSVQNQENIDAAFKMAQFNDAAQRDFAQNAVRWRVADANAAGINPLAALGMQATSYSNVVGPGNQEAPKVQGEPDIMGKAIGSAGQDIGRAIGALMDNETKNKQLDLELKRSQIASNDEDVVSKQLQNSKMATNVAPPGTPYSWEQGGPVDPRGLGKGRPLLTTQYWDPESNSAVTLLSPEASSSAMNTASMGENAVLAPWLVTKNLGHRDDGSSWLPTRSDIKRALGWGQKYVPESDPYGIGVGPYP